MAKQKFFVAGEEFIKIDDIMRDIKRQLRTKSGSPLDPKKVKDALQKINEGKFMDVIVHTRKIKNPILTLISGNGSLILDELDGKELLSEAKDVFNYIDSDFKSYGANERGKATKETSVNVYEMAKDATFSQMFGSLSEDVRSLCFTQSQIKNFVKKHRNHLRTDGWGTFFLFESNEQFFVARVFVDSSVGLLVLVYGFENSFIWDGESRDRVVVPQLAL